MVMIKQHMRMITGSELLERLARCVDTRAELSQEGLDRWPSWEVRAACWCLAPEREGDAMWSYAVAAWVWECGFVVWVD